MACNVGYLHLEFRNAEAFEQAKGNRWAIFLESSLAAFENNCHLLDLASQTLSSDHYVSNIWPWHMTIYLDLSSWPKSQKQWSVNRKFSTYMMWLLYERFSVTTLKAWKSWEKLFYGWLCMCNFVPLFDLWLWPWSTIWCPGRPPYQKSRSWVKHFRCQRTNKWADGQTDIPIWGGLCTTAVNPGPILWPIGLV